MFRWLALATFLSALGISARHRRRARRIAGAIPRRNESPGLILGRMLVAVPLFGGVLAYFANPEWMSWASLDVPSWVRWIGVAIGVLVVPSVHRVLATLGENVSETVLTKPGQRLVTTGPYRRVRHPLYAVGIGLFLSVGLMAANGFILACAAAALAGVRLVVIPREEARLVAAFGDEYRRYRERTGALLPPLRAMGRREAKG